MKLSAVWLVVAIAAAGAVPGAQDRSALADDFDVRMLYQASASQRLWTDAMGRPTTLAYAALTSLDDAAADGLDAADYGSASLRPFLCRAVFPLFSFTQRRMSGLTTA